MPTKGRTVCGLSSPPPDRRSDGSFNTKRVRIRKGWFGFAVAEELIERGDGSRFWQRIPFPRDVTDFERSA